MKLKLDSIRSVFLGATAALLVSGVSAQEVDLNLFKPSLKRLDDLPRSAEDNAKVDLGRHLYYEKRLSKDNTISCNSCHDLKDYGVDGEAFSKGMGGVKVGRNSPTVYNAFMHLTQFWDGRAATVEEQAKGPILAGKEMAMPSPEACVAKLKAIPEYQELFKIAFPRSKDPIIYDHVGEAIGTFERYLVTPSRFDAYLDGNRQALSAEEQKGLQTFVKVGCTTCHSGTLLGGQLYQKAGLVKDWPNQSDQGRFDLTKNADERMFFKVPSLRNIEKTGPYFHDSSANSLHEAVRKMGRHQLGLELPDNEIESIVAFLKSLTGAIPQEFVAQRKLEAPAKPVSLE